MTGSDDFENEGLQHRLEMIQRTGDLSSLASSAENLLRREEPEEAIQKLNQLQKGVGSVLEDIDRRTMEVNDAE